jgi:hypothetical protein
MARQVLGRFDFDTSGLSPHQIVELINKQIDIRRFKMTLIGAVVSLIAVLAATVLVVALLKEHSAFAGDNKKQKVAPKEIRDDAKDRKGKDINKVHEILKDNAEMRTVLQEAYAERISGRELRERLDPWRDKTNRYLCWRI